jgi:site-specific DNA-methyltransferase (adenine-specific)
MRRLPVTLHGRTFEVTHHDDGTFEMPPELAEIEGQNTALKPGQEMWWLVRKPLAGTVAANILAHGTGALNIAACRAGSGQRTNNAGGATSLQRVSRVEAGYRPTVTASEGRPSEVTGRWPANIVFTHSAACESAGIREVRSDGHHPAARGASGYESGLHGQSGLAERASGTEVVEAWRCADDCPVAELDRQSGVLTSGMFAAHHADNGKRAGTYGAMTGREHPATYGDTGGASRFYPTFRYQAKAPASERPRLADGTAHETVKSLGLMSWLVKLITPPGGTVLDMFAGSGPVG